MVLKSSSLGLVLINIFIGDLNGRREIIFTEPAGDIALCTAIALYSSIRMQYNLDK